MPPLYRLWLWMPCPKRWKLRHGLLDMAFPAASSSICSSLHRNLSWINWTGRDWPSVHCCRGQPCDVGTVLFGKVLRLRTDLWVVSASLVLVGCRRNKKVIFESSVLSAGTLSQSGKEAPHKHRDRPCSPNNENNETQFAWLRMTALLRECFNLKVKCTGFVCTLNHKRNAEKCLLQRL